MNRIFEKFNQASNCMICGTNKEGKSVLVPNYDVERDDNIMQAELVHLDCILDNIILISGYIKVIKKDEI